MRTEQELGIKEVVEITHEENYEPKRGSEESSGIDLRLNLTNTLEENEISSPSQEELVIKPGQRILASTTVKLKLPQGVEGQVRPRSGLAIKKGITVLNSPGTIDSDYINEEVKVILINLSKEKQTLKDKERIAQLVFQRITPVYLKRVNLIVKGRSGRNGGFGHTGTQ